MRTRIEQQIPEQTATRNKMIDSTKQPALECCWLLPFSFESANKLQTKRISYSSRKKKKLEKLIFNGCSNCVFHSFNADFLFFLYLPHFCLSFSSAAVVLLQSAFNSFLALTKVLFATQTPFSVPATRLLLDFE